MISQIKSIIEKNNLTNAEMEKILQIMMEIDKKFAIKSLEFIEDFVIDVKIAKKEIKNFNIEILKANIENRLKTAKSIKEVEIWYPQGINDGDIASLIEKDIFLNLNLGICFNRYEF